MLWGKYVALGKICCSGENMLLWGKYVTLGRKVALGRICSGENKKIGKKGENFTNF
ncbi:MAG TPA: hypothetical protein PLB63_07585 [Planctomycetota bacterium]|nr:hypothetical protein [Planctomycetota bacterium]